MGTYCEKNYENEIAKPKKSEPIFTYQLTSPDLQSQKSPKRAKSLKTRLITKIMCLGKAISEDGFDKSEDGKTKTETEINKSEFGKIKCWLEKIKSDNGLLKSEYEKVKCEIGKAKTENEFTISYSVNTKSRLEKFNIKSKIINK